MSCSVKGCPNIKRFKPEGISFHRFPQGPVLKEWLKVLNMPSNWQWSQNKFVCSEHFRDEDYVKKKDQRIRLTNNAVPCLKVELESSAAHGASTSSVGSHITDESVQRTHEASSSLSSEKEKSSSDDPIRTHLRRKLKRTITMSSGHETSSDSSSRKKRAKLIKAFHSYAVSPGKYKRKYEEIKERQIKSRKKLYDATKTIKNLKRKITTLKTVVDDLKQQQSLSENAIFHLEKCYEDVPHVLMSRYIKNVQRGTTSRESYSEKIRNFACTLHFYSAKAYEYVRNTFALALPHQSVIRKWSANIDCHPGFSEVCFDVLETLVQKAKSQKRKVICSLLLDEMAIKKQIEFDGKRMWGYVDIGTPLESDDVQPATEALVLMVTSHNSHWKLPIGYFFIKSLNGSERANIIKEALIRLHTVGVVVTSLTCDGPSVHFSMLKELGCNFDDVHNLQTWFFHPSDEESKVFCMLDVCHMLKLLRNLLGTLLVIITRDGRAEWRFIRQLFEIQEEETLTIANKLKKSHVHWQRQKMKVDLAAQTLSASVANALEFLDEELHHPDFEGVKPTVLFIRRIDRLFDTLNSRSPFASGFKGPMRESTEDMWKPFIMDTCQFLLECTDVSGRPLYCTPRKTPILGFVISALSAIGIFNAFVKTNDLKYLLTYKCSQDHLEIFFCSVRSRNGWNNNPTCLQFMRTFRKLLLFSRTSERGGNCKVLDDTVVLTVPSTIKTKTNTTDNVDVAICRKYNLEVCDELQEHDYDVAANFMPLNDISSNVVTYISGFVVKMLKKAVKCPDCIAGCILIIGRDDSPPKSYRLLLHKNEGGLHVPSEGVVKICEKTEQFIRKLMFSTDNKLPHDENFFTSFVTFVAQEFYLNAGDLFPDLVEHSLSFPPVEGLHLSILIKHIVNCYTRVRIYNLGKKITEKIQGTLVRKNLTKLILFNHQ